MPSYGKVMGTMLIEPPRGGGLVIMERKRKGRVIRATAVRAQVMIDIRGPGKL